MTLLLGVPLALHARRGYAPEQHRRAGGNREGFRHFALLYRRAIRQLYRLVGLGDTTASSMGIGVGSIAHGQSSVGSSMSPTQAAGAST